ncbi:hypothetical protein RCOM_0069820 [Ricinus communis]|uniref:Uncharacterized protein n=1 Tax=Ricinus communis TaxID=3988 RepID=B9SXH0_RICCO|nr:hypothetical protein RCOM_0069820 [Ricinus communis]
MYYDGVYKECCLRCQNCKRPFHGVPVAPPPVGMVVEGKEQYYCGLGYFPLKYDLGVFLGDKKGESSGGCGDSFLGGEKGKNEDFVVICDDSDDGDCGRGQEGENRSGKDCGLGLEGETVKSVARKTKKVMGRGKKVMMVESSGNQGTGVGGMSNMSGEFTEEDGDAQPETAGRNGSIEGSFESELEFVMGEDDIYVGFKTDA